MRGHMSRIEKNNLEALNRYFSNPDNKETIKKAICRNGKFYGRRDKGEIYHLPLGNLIVEILYEFGRFNVINAYKSFDYRRQFAQ